MLLTHLDKEARLIRIAHDFVVNDLEVAGQFDGLIVPDKLVSQRSDIKVNVIDAIGALVTPVGDDGLARELHAHNLFPLVIGVALILELANSLQACLRRHKLEDVVDSEGHAAFALKG